MLIYILIFILLLACRNTKKPIPMLLCFLILFSVAAFRDFRVGTDTGQYLARYDYVHEASDYFDNVFVKKGEYFESFLYIICHKLSLTFRHVLEIESFIFLSILFLFCKIRLEKPMMGVLIFFALYFYLSFFNIFRNIFALPIILFGYLFLEGSYERRNITREKGSFNKYLNAIAFVLVVLLGGTVHLSILVLLFLLPFNYVRFDFKVIFFLLFLTLFVGMLFDTSSLLGRFLMFLPDEDRFGGYVKNIGSHFVITPFIEMGFVILIYSKYKEKIDLDNNIYFKAWMLNLLFLHLFGFASTYGSRVVLSFSVAKCVLLADCLKYRHRDGSIIIYIYLLYSFAKNLIVGYDGVIPYKLMDF